MNPDDLKEAWKAESSMTRLAIEPEMLLSEVRRNADQFASRMRGRDVRELVVGILLVPVWLAMGYFMKLPWTWYLMLPVLVWYSVVMLRDLRRHTRKPPGADGSLRESVEDSLSEVRHQIRLLRNVFWWCLLPMGVPMLAFIGHVAWETRDAGWLTALMFGLVGGFIAVLFGYVYRLNQRAVSSELVPRERELEALLAGLGEEGAGVGDGGRRRVGEGVPRRE